ncbi:GrpB family protein [Gracilibacillus alcaliphilus]|uniref:GrpB family protein n=1 Tax=Gracilibacillus alcaliphilus TaxID=1401441 RepID=UPI001EF81162|nr:GrpB family protein [Gracilibacillus alcaliphilus]MBM7676205.1 GrpB-like predicted nucleotidyltransferase (UPF0157 family) [Gracilibacillus alcaliphilus]
MALKKVWMAEIGPFILAIEHVGSTSVRGLSAKPILDIDIVIATDSSFVKVRQGLEKLGYVDRGDLGIKGREAFGRQNKEVPWNKEQTNWMAHHLYVCTQDSRELRRHLAFRDYLRNHSQTAAAYEQLKRNLAQTAKDREHYTAAKSTFIEEVLKKEQISQ